MECYCSLRSVQDILADWKPLIEEDSENRSKDLLFHSAHENSSIRKESFTRNLSRVCIDRGRTLERRHSDCRYWGIGKLGRIRKFIPEDSMRKKSWYLKEMENLYFLWQMVQQNGQEETTNSGNPLQGGNRPLGLRISEEILKANRKSLNRQNQKTTLMSEETSGRFEVTSSIVITLNLEFNFICRKKEHSLFHWNTLT